MNNKENELFLIKFKDGEYELNVHISFEEKTAWLSQKEIASLFEKSVSTISEHIKEISEAEISIEKSMRKFEKNELSFSSTKPTTYYNKEIIMLVGKRLKSKRCKFFEEWLNSVLYKYYDDNEILPINSEISYDLVKFEDKDFSLEVKVSPDEDTVWLNAYQIAELFEKDYKTIRKHINNVFEENEVDPNNNSHFLRVVGVKQKVAFYSLNVIISVGYRVKSKRGVMFRQWANSVLKQYLMRGVAVNENRCLSCESNILYLQSKYNQIENRLNTIEEIVIPCKDTILYEGDVIDSYKLIRKIFFLAKKELIIIDYYIDDTIIELLKGVKVKTIIITATSNYLNVKNLPDNVSVTYKDIFHDRHIIADDFIYMVGTSIKDIGKMRSSIVRVTDYTKDELLK